MATSNEDILESINKLAALVSSEHEENRHQFRTIHGHVRELWKRVDGRSPPLNHDGMLSPIPRKDPRVDEDTPVPLEEHVSGHDLGLAALEGRLITVEKTLKTVNNHAEKTHEMQTAQSEAMGIGLGFFKYLGSKEGLRALAAVIAAIAGLIAAFNTSYSNYKKSLSP